MFDMGMGQLSTDELLAELSRRFDNIIVTGCNRPSEDGSAEFVEYRKGCPFTLIGLAQRATKRIERDLDE